eukprot:gb/GECG01010581.1/.p1 GENE.gb/GECG01010581.1/~~gb/GECG01010581.1/.p1  ORF type:complete len:377 (+),score=43.09 gb/GECG01010581.1/:1-1131(+)
MASVFHANRVTQKAPIAWQKDRNTRKPRVNDQVLCQYRSSLPEGIPSGKPHPHFPCVVIDDSNIKGVTEAVVDGIEAVVDEVHYNRNPQDSDRNTYSVDASVFFGGERINFSIHVFIEGVETKENLVRVLLQAFCHSGYGWNFYSVWESILEDFKATGLKVERYVPEVEENPSGHYQRSMAAAVAHNRTRPFHCEEPSAFSPNCDETDPPVLPDMEIHAPAAVPGESTDEDFISLMESKFENERCLGMEFVGSDLKKFGTPAVIRCLFKCVGSESSYSGSRIRAMSLLNRMVKSGLCSASLIDFDSLKSGLTALVRECRDESNCSPSFLYMVDEYVSFAEKFIETVAKRLHVEADSSIRDKAAKLKQFCNGNRTCL